MTSQIALTIDAYR